MINLKLTDEQAITTASALLIAIDKTRKFLIAKDPEFGQMNSLHRGFLSARKATHAKLLVELRAAGYPMEGADVKNLNVDSIIGGNFEEYVA